jgi:hypothetical protein
MMGDRKSSDEAMVSITASHMERFHGCAAAAIRHRSGSYALEELGKATNYLLVGGVPLVGILWFDWSGSQLVLFFLVGVWVEIICDAVKLFTLREGVDRFAKSRYDDWHVWVVVEALRNGKKKAPSGYLGAKYEPGPGVFLDIVLGGLSTAIIGGSLMDADADFLTRAMGSNSVWYSLLGIVTFGFLFTAWEIIDHNFGAGKDRGVKVAVGLRGVGLFLLMFTMLIVAAAADSFLDDALDPEIFARLLMLALNSLIVIYGVLTALGPWMLRSETEWLREYLATREAK